MLRPGMFLQDRYEILDQIGSGGMSVVYKAKCHKLNRLVAIKVLKEEFSTDANFVQKFKMEAQAAAGLTHPNIVNVYDVIDEGSIHYIVMELIEGITLKNYIAKKGRLGVKETVAIAIQVAQGMDAAHEQNIIHRDIKPQNMIISRDGKVKVADFGIARAVSSQTLNSAAMGSVHYISPEQARGGYSDARSDIYSLGITMYEMITGRLPFEGENTVTIAISHLQDPITPPSVYAPDISSGLEMIILKCTEKKPDRRYDSATELISDLRRVLLSQEEDFSRGSQFYDNDQNTIPIPPISQVREMPQRESRRLYQEPTTYENGQRPPQSGTKSGGKNKENQTSDIAPKIEKMFTAAGVVAAIIIVAVLLFMVTRLSGLFQAKTYPSGDTSVSAESGSQESLSSKQVLMPEVVGLTEEMARAKLEDGSLSMRIEGYEYSDTYEKGVVMRQGINKDAAVDKYSQVTVVISNGSDKINLKTLGLEGTDGAAAKDILTAKQLVVVLETQENATIPKDKVISYSPVQAKAGDKVTLFVSIGVVETTAAVVPVPDITGVAEADAIEKLTAAGLKPGEVQQAYSDAFPKGAVMDQGISQGSQLPRDSVVNYTVSQGPEPKAYRYLAALDTTYSLKNIIGPGSGTIELNVKIRLKQVVDGKTEYRDLTSPVKVTGDTILPVSFPNIEGAYGVDKGEVEIINSDTEEILNAYPLTFIAVPK